MDEQRTAIVTGAGKRIGADVVLALLERGWTVLAHVRREEDEVPAGALAVAADLDSPDCAERIFEAAKDLPPVRLLVNNAARFAWDSLGEFSPDEFDSHMHVNVRSPVLLMEALAKRHAGGDALVVNILDSKLAAPNADFLSYTISKQALLGATGLAARALASRGIRVNAISPALMLRSPGQSQENFEAMHERNPLGRGVTSADIVAAIDYLVAARTVTGEVLTIDGGQRFDPPPRDVQFLES
jgi:NAD(P)-dependent dehydrogenase (short-subunit alcohol dehydrogenase family)